MPFGRLTLEDVARAAVGANGFAGMQDIEENARVLVPCRRAGQRAVQRQVFCRNFDGELVSHIDFPVCLMIDGARGEWYFFFAARRRNEGQILADFASRMAVK